MRKRKIGLLAAAAGAAFCGTMAKADFTITSTRTVGNVVNPSGGPAGTYDTVDFFLTGTGTSNSVAGSSSITGALYDASGMLIGVGAGGKSPVGTTQADIFATASAVNNNYLTQSWVADNTSPFSLGSTTSDSFGGHGAVLLMGNTPSSSGGVDPLGGTTFTANELVAGVYGTIFNSGGTAQATPIEFAQAVVPTGSTVFLLNPSGTKGSASANASRLFGPSSGIFSPGGGFSNAAANNLSAPFQDPVATPEPGSIGLIGLGMAGLIARRRRRA